MDFQLNARQRPGRASLADRHQHRQVFANEAVRRVVADGVQMMGACGYSATIR